MDERKSRCEGATRKRCGSDDGPSPSSSLPWPAGGVRRTTAACGRLQPGSAHAAVKPPLASDQTAAAQQRAERHGWSASQGLSGRTTDDGRQPNFPRVRKAAAGLRSGEKVAILSVD